MGEIRATRLACMLVLILCFAVPREAQASRVFQLSPDQDVIGRMRYSYAQAKDTLLDIARDYDLGYSEITAANPSVDPWVPSEGMKVRVPACWILPSSGREGIVLNMAEMRLYYFYNISGKPVVVTYPVGVGMEGFDTPLGVFSVTGMQKDPTWYPPAAIRAERPELPEAVPPGPDNPLGGYRISLNIPGYRIHGTNRPWGVGRRVSHGCIRLYPEDIAKLFGRVAKGTRVEIVYQPVKVGLEGGRLMVEAHEDYLRSRDLMEEALDKIEKKGLTHLLDAEALYRAVEEKKGIPTDVTLRGGQAR